MSRVRNNVLSIACAGLLLTAVAACGGAGGSGGPAPGLEKTDITVGAAPVSDEAGLFIAQDLGYFKAAGLDVTIKPVLPAADVARGQNDGTYDITAGNSVSYIQTQVAGVSDLEIVAEGSLMEPGNQALYTLPGSLITSVSQLKGKRIGVNAQNNIGTLLISELLEAQGISPKQVQFVVIPGGFPGMAPALLAGHIDVAWLPEPFGSIDGDQYGLQDIADLDQGAASSFPIGWYVVTKQWAKKYPRTLAAFLGALRQGQNVADTDRVAVEQAMEKLPGSYAVPPDIAAIMSLESYPLNVYPDIDASRVQRVADAMLNYNMLSKSFQVRTMLTP